MVSRVSDRHTLDLGACQGGGAPGNPQVLSQDPGTSVPRSRATGRPWCVAPASAVPRPCGGPAWSSQTFSLRAQHSGIQETEPSDDAALQKTGERTRRGPEPQTHSTWSQLCDRQNFAPPPPGKKNHVLGTWPERTRRSVSCKITRDKTSSLKHEKKKTQEVRREN